MHAHVFETLCVLFMVVRENVYAPVRCARVCEVCAEYGVLWVTGQERGGAVLSQTLGL